MTQWTAATTLGEGHHGRCNRLGDGVKSHGHLGDDAQRALGPGEELGQAVPGRGLARSTGRPDHTAFSRDHRERNGVVSHGAVTDGVRSRGGSRDHAADACIGARVDGEEEPRCGKRGVECFARDARLDGRAEVFRTHRDDLVHPAHVDRHATGNGEQMTLDRRAHAVGDDRYTVFSAKSDDPSHLLCALGVCHAPGRTGRVWRLVAAMGHAVRWACRPAPAEHLGQPVGQGHGKRLRPRTVRMRAFACRRFGQCVHRTALPGEWYRLEKNHDQSSVAHRTRKVQDPYGAISCADGRRLRVCRSARR